MVCVFYVTETAAWSRTAWANKGRRNDDVTTDIARRCCNRDNLIVACKRSLKAAIPPPSVHSSAVLPLCRAASCRFLVAYTHTSAPLAPTHARARRRPSAQNPTVLFGRCCRSPPCILPPSPSTAVSLPPPPRRTFVVVVDVVVVVSVRCWCCIFWRFLRTASELDCATLSRAASLPHRRAVAMATTRPAVTMTLSSIHQTSDRSSVLHLQWWTTIRPQSRAVTGYKLLPSNARKKARNSLQ